MRCRRTRLLGIAAVCHFMVGPAILAQSLDSLHLAKNFQAMRESSANLDLTKNGDARPIEPGGELVLADVEGPGIISHLWFTCNAKDPFYGRSLVLACYWDESTEPSVEVPLGDFFGVGHAAEADLQSIPIFNNANGRARNSFFKMPFRSRARIVVRNDSSQHRVDSFYYHVDWEKHESLPEPILYFHARYRQEHPAQPGDFLVLDTKGRGHFVGMTYSVLQVKNGWFGEGDDRFYIDGEAEPRLKGTGTEDYFGDAWGMHARTAPFLGASIWDGYVAGDRTTAYRWHILDPVPFRNHLKVAFEHRGSVYTDLLVELGSFLERPDWISSVAYWYQTPIVPPAENLPAVDQRIPPYLVIGAEELVVRAEPSAILNKSKEGIAYLPMKGEAKIELDFEVREKGRYQVLAWLQHTLAGGRYQPFLDGEPVGPELDLCVEGSESLRVSFDLHDLKPGTHTLSFEGRGKSSKQRTRVPLAHAFGLQRVVLLRLEDLQGYRDRLK